MNEKELEKLLDYINRIRLEDLEYAIKNNGRLPKQKYYEEDFYYSNTLDKKDFYWDEEDKCYYMKSDVDMIKYNGCTNPTIKCGKYISIGEE